MFKLNKNLCFENRKTDVFVMGELLLDMISSEYDDSGAMSILEI